MSKKTGMIIFSGTVIVLSITAIWLATKFRKAFMPFDVGSRAFPIMICVIMIFLSVIIIIRELYSGSSEKLNMVTPKTVLCFGILAAYVYLLPVLGFILDSMWIMVVTMLIMGARKPLSLIFYPICFIAVLYFLFSWVLKVPLPMGILEYILY